MSDQIQGVTVTQLDSSEEFDVGTETVIDGAHYLYVKNTSGAALSATHPYIYNESFEVKLVAETGNVTNGDSVPACIAMSAIANNGFGWVFCGPGAITAAAEGAIAAQKIVYITATGTGTLDDAVIAGMKVYGLTTPTAVSGAGSASFMAASRLFISA